MLAATTRWWWMARKDQLVAHLLPRFVLWFLLSVQIDAAASLAAASRQLLGEPPWSSAILWLLLCVVVLLDERRFAGSLVLGRGTEVLRRQPVPPWAHGPGIALLVGIVLLPLAAAGLLAWRDPAAAMLWGGAALLPQVLWSARRPVLTGVALALGAASIGLGHDLPMLRLPLAAAVWAAAIPLSGRVAWHHGQPHDDVPWMAPWRPRTAIGGVVQRDLVLLWRLERPLLLSSVLLAPFAAALVATARAHGPYEGWSLAVAASVLLVLVAPTSLTALATAARHLGPQLDPPRWPLTTSRRAVALVLVAAMPVSPAWAGVALGGGAGLGVSAQAGMLFLAASISTGAAAFVAVRPERPNHGAFLWYLGAAIATAHVGGATFSALLAAMGLMVTRRALQARRNAR